MPSETTSVAARTSGWKLAGIRCPEDAMARGAIVGKLHFTGRCMHHGNGAGIGDEQALAMAVVVRREGRGGGHSFLAGAGPEFQNDVGPAPILLDAGMCQRWKQRTGPPNCGSPMYRSSIRCPSIAMPYFVIWWVCSICQNRLHLGKGICQRIHAFIRQCWLRGDVAGPTLRFDLDCAQNTRLIVQPVAYQPSSVSISTARKTRTYRRSEPVVHRHGGHAEAVGIRANIPRRKIAAVHLIGPLPAR